MHLSKSVNLSIFKRWGPRLFAAWSLLVVSAIAVLAQSLPTPAIRDVTPASTLVGGVAFTLTVNGSNYISQSVVRWNGKDRTTTFVSTARLTAAIPASDIATAGTVDVTVFNPSPAGCNCSSLSVTFSINNPVPTMTSFSPTSAAAGGPAFTLTVTGTNFVAASTVQWNGLDRTTTFDPKNPTQLKAAIPASDIAKAGTATIFVFNPPPGGGGSSANTFFINNPPPTISSISPNLLPTGSSAFTLTVNGTNFNSASTVQWNGSNRATTFISFTQLTAAIPASDLATGGAASVTVVNPPPGGGSSNAVFFNINALPTLTSLSPSYLAAGSVALTLTVNGTNFNGVSVVRWNASNRTTTFVSSTQLTAAIPATDVSAAGMADVTVLNPGSSGGTSNAKPFTVFPPLAITTASPLPNGTLGLAYSQMLEGTGGTSPYAWSIAVGTLPDGLTLNLSTGVISGTPTKLGDFNFGMKVIDNNLVVATKDFSLLITLQTSAVSITGVSDTVSPADQPKVGVALSAAESVAISGQLVLTFSPDADNPSGESDIKDDPSIQFSSGGRTIDFSVPVGNANAVFPNNASDVAFQTGTVAGTINLSIVNLQTGGADVTPSPSPSRTVTLNRSAPVITNLSIGSRTASGFEAQVSGYSTPRSLTQATFRFSPKTGGNLQTTTLTLDVSAPFVSWYQSVNSKQFGSQFKLTVPFTVQGDINAIGSVSVTLTNVEGTSESVSVNF